MPQTDQTPDLLPNYDGTYNSYYPDGDKPEPPPEPEPEPPALSGGTPALAYTISALEDGAALTLTTDGTFDFGDTGPNLAFLLDATKVDGDGKIIPIVGENCTLSSGYLFAIDNDDMPQGKGYRIGTTVTAESPNSVEGAIMRFNWPASTKVFDSRIYHFPAENRALAAPVGGWQLKPIWHQANNKFGGDGTNFFMVTWQRWYGDSETGRWYRNHFISSNSIASLSIPNSLMPSLDERNNPVSDPIHTETAWDQGDVTDGIKNGTCEAASSCSSLGTMVSVKAENLELFEPGVGNIDKIISGCTYPGYCKGFAYADGTNCIDADAYVSYGDGAFCRVAISDNADYFSSGRKTILEPISWSSNEIKMKLRNGWWGVNEIGGRWINIIGSDNSAIASVQIVGGE